MKFTDEDLKRLKECVSEKVEHTVHAKGECVDLKALLARLEAAEHCLLDSGLTEKEKDERFEVWRKSKGELWRI